MALADLRILDLPVVAEPRGNLTFVESGRQVPFSIERVYYLYDVPSGAERGGHAHRALHQVLIALSGGFDVHVDDGAERAATRRPHDDTRGRRLGVGICRPVPADQFLAQVERIDNVTRPVPA